MYVVIIEGMYVVIIEGTLLLCGYTIGYFITDVVIIEGTSLCM